MTCRASHTKLQVPEEDWKCPKCGAGPEFFYIEDPDSDADEDCTLLHDNDTVYCHRCNEGWSGRQYTRKLDKLNKGLIIVQVRNDQHTKLIQICGSQKAADRQVQLLIDQFLESNK